MWVISFAHSVNLVKGERFVRSEEKPEYIHSVNLEKVLHES